MEKEEIRIQVIDDSHSIAAVIELVLRKNGFTGLKTSHEPRQALDDFLQFKPNVVISDYLLPIKNGLELMRDFHEKREELKEDWNYAVILLSGYLSNRELQKEAKELGACAILEKPIKPDQLVLSVQQAIASSQG